MPRLPGAIIERLVEHFGGLQKLLAASVDDLQAVDGVGEARARSVREGLSRLAESSHPGALRLSRAAPAAALGGQVVSRIGDRLLTSVPSRPSSR